MSLYDITVKNRKGEDVSLANYKDKVLLIVNTATNCGFTPQYQGLQNLYKSYHDKGFAILDFPCNQFLKQAPGTDDEINSFCVSKYFTTFDRFQKIDVNGENASPLYKFLKEKKPEDKIEGFFSNVGMKMTKLISSTCKEPKDIKWNFTKFLVDKEGNVVGRYPPTCKPENIETKIRKLLNITEEDTATDAKNEEQK